MIHNFFNSLKYYLIHIEFIIIFETCFNNIFISMILKLFYLDSVYYNYNYFRGNQEWAVPHQIKLKYTQLFNTTDRTRTGFLTGVQARGIMVATQLPQNVLAQIW